VDGPPGLLLRRGRGRGREVDERAVRLGRCGRVRPADGVRVLVQVRRAGWRGGGRGQVRLRQNGREEGDALCLHSGGDRVPISLGI
jgi:hypothetical protein